MENAKGPACRLYAPGHVWQGPPPLSVRQLPPKQTKASIAIQGQDSKLSDK